MREVLFRIKCGDKWYYGFPLAKQYFDIGKHTGFNGYDENGQSYFDIFASYETLSEFTGLLDKNGKRIFEGDILRVITPTGIVGFTEVGIGEYFDGEKDYIGVYGRVGSDCSSMLAKKEKHYEIIGNKWDNPELLEKVNNCETYKYSL